MSAELPSVGVSVDEHEKPYAPPLQPATLASGAQLLVAAAAMQQYRELPFVSLTPAPQASVGSAVLGTSAPAHEYPVEPFVQPALSSIAQPLLACTSQQYPVSPLASATPAPQVSVGSFCLGVTSPSQE